MSYTRASAQDQAPGPADTELDLKLLFGALWRHKLWILVPTVIALAGAVVFVNLATPRYTAEARIVIENLQSPLTRQGGDRQQSPEQVPIDQEAVASQVQIIYSRDIARAVVAELGLTQLTEFDPLAQGRSALGTLLGFVGLARDLSALSAEERALEAYFERLAAYPVDRSRVIEIRFTSRDPDLAARVANAVAQRFIQTQIDARLDRDRRARQHFERTIENLRQQVTQAENRVQEFRSRNDLMTGTSNQTLGVQTASELNTQLSTAQAQRADTQARATAIREMLRSGRPIEASEVLASPIIVRLTEQRGQLRAELALQGTVLLPGHPRMRELQAQLVDNEAQTRAAAERIVRSLENEARIAGERVAAIRRALDEQKRLSATQGDHEVQLRALEREARSQRELLESWLGMHREATARESQDARTADARIVSTAAASNTPAWPRKLPTVLIATLSTFFAMLVLVLTRELLSGRAFVHRPMLPRSVAFGTQEPIVFDPLPPRGPELPPQGPGGAPKPQGAPIGAIVAAALPRLLGPAAPPKRIVAACLSEDGRSAEAALEIARALSVMGRRTVLVDLDPGAAAIGPAGDLGEVPGISDFVAGRARLGEVIHRDPASRAHMVPLGTDPAALDDDAISGTRVATMLAALDAGYDSVVLATASILRADTAVVLAPNADVVALFVTRSAGEDVLDAARRAFALAGPARLEVVDLDVVEVEMPLAPAPEAPLPRAA